MGSKQCKIATLYTTTIEILRIRRDKQRLLHSKLIYQINAHFFQLFFETDNWLSKTMFTQF